MRRLFIVAVALASAALAGCSSSTNTSSSGSSGGTTTAGTTGTSSGTTTGTSSGTTGNTNSGTTGNTNSGTTGSNTGDLKDVEASHSTTLALKNDGTVWCVGDNTSGLCTTDFNNTPQVATWTQVAGVSGSPTQLATGDNFACVLQSGGTVQCWGTNGAGECGNGSINTTGPIAPTAVAGLSGVTQLAGHGTQKFMCALKNDGTVWCWGENDSGQLAVAPDFTNTAGDGNPYIATPTQVAGITGATSIAVGIYNACAVLADHSVKCWGDNLNGQLGVSPSSVSQTDCTAPSGGQTVPCSVTPLTVAGISATKVGFATFHACAIATSGNVMCWGFDGDGELGGTTVTNPGNPTLTPVATAHTFTNAKDIACYGDGTGGTGGCVAVDGNDSVWAWGDNLYGQLDQDSTNFPNTVTDSSGNSPGSGPVQVTPLGSGHITHVSVTLQAVVTYDNGTAYGWGYDNQGQLGDQGNSNVLPPIQLTGI